MEGYLGETKVDIKDSPYKGYTKKDWALLYILKYGGIDGSHHKDWVLDQIARILNGTKVNIKVAKWSNGQEEYRVNLAKGSKKYKAWVAECKSGEDGPDTYGYEKGIAP